MDSERERLRDLSARVVRLHKLLLDRERGAYESLHGPIPPAELFRLVLGDPQFAWLRTLSTMIARIDDRVDADELSADDVQGLFGEAYRLLKAGGSGEFHDKYRAALQESADVVMAHADVSRVLPAPSPP